MLSLNWEGVRSELLYVDNLILISETIEGLSNELKIGFLEQLIDKQS